MAILRQGILGGFRNKVGSVVGYRWVDLDVIRGYVIPANPNSTDQQTQRNKFTACLPFSQIVYSFPDLVYFWELVKGSAKTAWAAILKANIAKCQTNGISTNQRVLPDNVFDYEPNSISAGASNLTATIPALNTFLDIPVGASSVSFVGVLAFLDPDDPLQHPYIVTGLLKAVSGYTFTAEYSLSIALSEVQKTAATLYATKMIYICAVIKDVDGNILAGLSPLLGHEAQEQTLTLKSIITIIVVSVADFTLKQVLPEPTADAIVKDVIHPLLNLLFGVGVAGALWGIRRRLNY